MGKDVILILIILLSYKILTKLTDTVEGADHDEVGMWGRFLRNIIQPICDLEDKLYDPLNYNCVSPQVRIRPPLCRDNKGREIPCKWRGRGENTENDEKPDMCQYNDYACYFLNFSPDIQGVKDVEGTIKALTLDFFERRYDFKGVWAYMNEKKDENTLGVIYKKYIQGEDIVSMLNFYRGLETQPPQISFRLDMPWLNEDMLDIATHLKSQETLDRDIQNALGNSPQTPEEFVREIEKAFFRADGWTEEDQLNAVIEVVHPQTNSGGNVGTLLRVLQLVGVERNTYGDINLFVLMVLIKAFLYYNNYKESRISNDEMVTNGCVIENNFYSLAPQSGQPGQPGQGEQNCAKKPITECMQDPFCLVKDVVWTLCKPGEYEMDNNCVPVAEDEYTSIVNKGDAKTYLDIDTHTKEKHTDNASFESFSIPQRCDMADDFVNTSEILTEHKDQRTQVSASGRIGYSDPSSIVNIPGTVPNQEDITIGAETYYKNSMCNSCFAEDDGRKSIPENLNFTKSEQSGKDYFCGVRGDWVPSTESEVSTENLGKHCSERVGESQCTGTSVGDQIPCKWVSYEEDEDEKSDMLGKCIPRCPTKYYSETEGRCLEVQKGNTPVQTSSIYKTCKIVSEDECRLSPICQPWEYAGEEFCGPRDPNADPDADPDDMIHNHIFSVADMVHKTDQFFLSRFIPSFTTLPTFLGGGKLIVDNRGLPILDDNLPCSYLKKVYDEDKETCVSCPDNTKFDKGECINELTCQPLLNTILKQTDSETPFGVNKCDCSITSFSTDGKKEPDWYKPNCNHAPRKNPAIDVYEHNCLFIEEKDDCTDGCQWKWDDPSLSGGPGVCVPKDAIERDGPDLTLKDIGYEYYLKQGKASQFENVLSPADRPTAGQTEQTQNAGDADSSSLDANLPASGYVDLWKLSYAPTFPEPDENNREIRNRYDLCNFNGSYGTCETCFDDVSLTENKRDEDGTKCITDTKCLWKDEDPSPGVVDKCKLWGYEETNHRKDYWPAQKNSSSHKLDFIDSSASSDTTYILFMDIKTKHSFVAFIQEYEKTKLPSFQKNDSRDEPIDYTVPQNKKIRIPWQNKDARIIEGMAYHGLAPRAGAASEKIVSGPNSNIFCQNGKFKRREGEESTDLDKRISYYKDCPLANFIRPGGNKVYFLNGATNQKLPYSFNMNSNRRRANSTGDYDESDDLFNCQLPGLDDYINFPCPFVQSPMALFNIGTDLSDSGTCRGIRKWMIPGRSLSDNPAQSADVQVEGSCLLRLNDDTPSLDTRSLYKNKDLYREKFDSIMINRQAVRFSEGGSRGDHNFVTNDYQIYSVAEKDPIYFTNNYVGKIKGTSEEPTTASLNYWLRSFPLNWVVGNGVSYEVINLFESNENTIILDSGHFPHEDTKNKWTSYSPGGESYCEPPYQLTNEDDSLRVGVVRAARESTTGFQVPWPLAAGEALPGDLGRDPNDASKFIRMKPGMNNSLMGDGMFAQSEELSDLHRPSRDQELTYPQKLSQHQLDLALDVAGTTSIAGDPYLLNRWNRVSRVEGAEPWKRLNQCSDNDNNEDPHPKNANPWIYEGPHGVAQLFPSRAADLITETQSMEEYELGGAFYTGTANDGIVTDGAFQWNPVLAAEDDGGGIEHYYQLYPEYTIGGPTQGTDGQPTLLCRSNPLVSGNVDSLEIDEGADKECIAAGQTTYCGEGCFQEGMPGDEYPKTDEAFLKTVFTPIMTRTQEENMDNNHLIPAAPPTAAQPYTPSLITRPGNQMEGEIHGEYRRFIDKKIIIEHEPNFVYYLDTMRKGTEQDKPMWDTSITVPVEKYPGDVITIEFWSAEGGEQEQGAQGAQGARGPTDPLGPALVRPEQAPTEQGAVVVPINSSLELIDTDVNQMIESITVKLPPGVVGGQQIKVGKDQYGVPFVKPWPAPRARGGDEDAHAHTSLYKYVRYIDRGRLTENPHDPLYPLTNMVIKTPEKDNDTENIYSFTSDADISSTSGEGVDDVLNKVLNTDRFEESASGTSEIMNERYINIQEFQSPDLLLTNPSARRLPEDKEGYIKYRTIFDILLNYSSSNVSLQNQENETRENKLLSEMDNRYLGLAGICENFKISAANAQGAQPNTDNAPEAQADTAKDKYKESLKVYFGIYIYLKAMINFFEKVERHATPLDIASQSSKEQLDATKAANRDLEEESVQDMSLQAQCGITAAAVSKTELVEERTFEGNEGNENTTDKTLLSLHTAFVQITSLYRTNQETGWLDVSAGVPSESELTEDYWKKRMPSVNISSHSGSPGVPEGLDVKMRNEKEKFGALSNDDDEWGGYIDWLFQGSIAADRRRGLLHCLSWSSAQQLEVSVRAPSPFYMYFITNLIHLSKQSWDQSTSATTGAADVAETGNTDQSLLFTEQIEKIDPYFIPMFYLLNYRDMSRSPPPGNSASENLLVSEYQNIIQENFSFLDHVIGGRIDDIIRELDIKLKAPDISVDKGERISQLSAVSDYSSLMENSDIKQCSSDACAKVFYKSAATEWCRYGGPLPSTAAPAAPAAGEAPAAQTTDWEKGTWRPFLDFSISEKSMILGIDYYADLLMDFTFDALSDHLEVCVYLGEKDKLNSTELNTNSKREDHSRTSGEPVFTGSQKNFHQIIPYRKKELYTNRSFIEIMEEDTIADDNNGLDMRVFLNEYKQDILKDFTDESRGSSGYTPLNYPIPDLQRQEQGKEQYKSRKKIMDKMIEICNQPKDPGASINLNQGSIIDPIKNTERLHSLFQEDEKIVLGKSNDSIPWRNVELSDIHCYKLDDILNEGGYGEYGDGNDGEYVDDGGHDRYCNIIDPLCKASESGESGCEWNITESYPADEQNEGKKAIYSVGNLLWEWFSGFSGESVQLTAQLLCSDGVSGDQAACEAVGGTWSRTTDTYCSTSCQTPQMESPGEADAGGSGSGSGSGSEQPHLIPGQSALSCTGMTSFSNIMRSGKISTLMDAGLDVAVEEVFPCEGIYNTIGMCEEFDGCNYAPGGGVQREESITDSITIADNLLTPTTPNQSEKATNNLFQNINTYDGPQRCTMDNLFNNENSCNFDDINVLSFLTSEEESPLTYEDDFPTSTSNNSEEDSKCLRYCSRDNMCQYQDSQGGGNLASNEAAERNIISQINNSVSQGCPLYSRRKNNSPGSFIAGTMSEGELNACSFVNVNECEAAVDQSKKFQDNTELFMKCEKWANEQREEYLACKKKIEDKLVGADLATPEEYSKRLDNLNRNLGPLDSPPPLECKLPDPDGDYCYNFVSDKVVYDKLSPSEKDLRNKNLDQINIRSNGTNKAPFASQNNSIFPPSPLDPDLSNNYVNKYFIGEFEYGKYINPLSLITPEDSVGLPQEKLKDIVELSDTGDAPQILQNVRKYIPQPDGQTEGQTTYGSCYNESETENSHWPFNTP